MPHDGLSDDKPLLFDHKQIRFNCNCPKKNNGDVQQHVVFDLHQKWWIGVVSSYNAGFIFVNLRCAFIDQLAVIGLLGWRRVDFGMTIGQTCVDDENYWWVWKGAMTTAYILWWGHDIRTTWVICRLFASCMVRTAQTGGGLFSKHEKWGIDRWGYSTLW